jgi:flagellar secretion chaperone FliS
MNQDQIASAYRQISTRGTSPVGLVVKLYDAIVEDFRRSLAAVESGDVERRVNSLNHALVIIAELESVLDFDRGGNVAAQLRGFYEVTRTMIVEANVRASREKLQKLRDLYVPLRQAWQQVELDVASGKIALPASSNHSMPTGPSPRRQTIGMNVEPDDPQAQWSA